MRERPCARVQNKTCGKEVIRKCPLLPAPPSRRDPRHPGCDNVLGAGGGGQRLHVHETELGACRSPPNALPLPRGLGLGGPMPTAPVREPGEKRAVEEPVGSEEGAARAKRGPAVRFAAAALGVSRAGAGAAASLTPLCALRFVEPSHGLVPSKPKDLASPKVSPRPLRHLPVPTAPRPAQLRETLPMAPGPPGFFPDRHPHSVADTARASQLPAHLRRFRRRWTQETPGSPTPALVDPPLRLTPLVSLQNGAGGRALTSRPFPSPFSAHHSLPARRGLGPAPTIQRRPPAAAAQSRRGGRGFKPIARQHSQKPRKKPGSC